jgi:hypothetical protein
VSEQKISKPKIEEVINEYIKDENAKKIMLDFIAWLRKNKMSPSWNATNSWKVSRNKQKVFILGVDKNVITINRFWLNFTDEYQAYIINNNLQNIVWNNFTVCSPCNGCPPSSDSTGISMNICGKEIKNICRGAIMKFVNPDYETIEGIKKLLEYNK